MWGSSAAIHELTNKLVQITGQLTNQHSSDIAALSMTIRDGQREITEALRESARSAQSCSDQIRNLTDSLEETAAVLRRFICPPKPGTLQLVIISESPSGEKSMPDILHFDAILPEPPQGRTDIVNGQLTVQIGDQEPIVVLTEKGQRSVTGLSGPQGATVTMSFVYVDDSGNMSQNASVLTETLKDTVPPPAPGAMGMAITGETHEPASPSEQPAPTSPSEQPEPTSPSQPPEG